MPDLFVFLNNFQQYRTAERFDQDGAPITRREVGIGSMRIVTVECTNCHPTPEFNRHPRDSGNTRERMALKPLLSLT